MHTVNSISKIVVDGLKYKLLGFRRNDNLSLAAALLSWNASVTTRCCQDDNLKTQDDSLKTALVSIFV